MSRILIVGEDDLTCAMGERIVSTLLPTWSLAAPVIRRGGITKLIQALPRYEQFARNLAHVLCIADSDGKCPAELLAEWFPKGRPARFLMRFAEAEAESWALGDRKALSAFLRVPVTSVPAAPDLLDDPKRELLYLAKRSRVRQIREEMLSPSRDDRPGVGYNVHLKRFIQTTWNPLNAEQVSASLHRAMNRVRQLTIPN